MNDLEKISKLNDENIVNIGTLTREVMGRTNEAKFATE